MERPFERELLNEDARKKLPAMLADSEQAAELLEKMDVALLSVPLDSRTMQKNQSYWLTCISMLRNVYDLPREEKGY